MPKLDPCPHRALIHIEATENGSHVEAVCNADAPDADQLCAERLRRGNATGVIVSVSAFEWSAWNAHVDQGYVFQRMFDALYTIEIYRQKHGEVGLPFDEHHTTTDTEE
jgi:hypothetical protein